MRYLNLLVSTQPNGIAIELCVVGIEFLDRNKLVLRDI
jgi:hypothetical protein